MLEFETKGKNGHYFLKLPTSLNEITPDYLNDVTSDIVVAPDYSLIGVVYREKLSTLILAANQRKKESAISVIPIMIKTGKSSNQMFDNITIGNKLVISPSDIAMGHHIGASRNKLTINDFLRYTDGDGYAYQNASKHNEYCYFIEFKIVPNCNIHGYYSNEDIKVAENPFVFKASESNLITGTI